MKYYNILIIIISLSVIGYRHFTRVDSTTLLNYFTETPTDDIVFSIPIYLYTDNLQFPDIVDAVDIQIRTELAKLQYDEIVNFQFDLRFGEREFDLKLNESVNKFNENAHSISFSLRDLELLFNNPIERSSEFIFKEPTVFSNDFPYFLTQTVVHQIFSYELQRFKTDNFMRTDLGVVFGGAIDDKTHLNILIKSEDIELNNNTFLNRFQDLRKLYSFDLQIVDEFPLDKSNDTYQFLIAGNATEVDNDTVNIVYDTSSEVSLLQMMFDIEDSLFNQLHFISDPQVIPLRVDMELRFRILVGLLEFIKILNEKTTKLDNEKVIQLFEMRLEILRVVRYDYDWLKLYWMTLNLNDLLKLL